MDDGDLFSPFSGYDAGCSVAILLGAMIAAGGGLGGGGVFVPLYILILSFETKHAAALSQATIFGGSIVNMIMNFQKWHPTRKHRPLTDFPTLLVFEPMLLVGTVIGVLLNVMFPDMLILILLIVVLGYATFRTGRKGVRMWQKETLESLSPAALGNGYIINESSKNEAKTVGDGITPPTEVGYDTDVREESDDSNGKPTEYSLLSSPSQNKMYGSVDSDSASKMTTEYDSILWKDMANACGVDQTELSMDKIAQLQPLIAKESSLMRPLIIILLIWIVCSTTAICKQSSITGVSTCGTVYWIILFSSFPIMIFLSWYFAKEAFGDYQSKCDSGAWNPAHGDIEWNRSYSNIAKYPAVATFAGTAGGLLGIGGGMIVSPLLLELGVTPRVAAATSAMAVMITSSSATLQFILLGYLDYDYMLWFMAIGVIGTFLGQTVIDYGIKAYGRVSLIIFAVAMIMGAAIILMGVDGIIDCLDGVSWDFSSAC